MKPLFRTILLANLAYLPTCHKQRSLSVVEATAIDVWWRGRKVGEIDERSFVATSCLHLPVAFLILSMKVIKENTHNNSFILKDTRFSNALLTLEIGKWYYMADAGCF